MSVQVLPVLAAVHVLEGVQPRPHADVELGPRLDIGVEQGVAGPHGQRVIGAQQLGHGSQREHAVGRLGEDVLGRQRAQYPLERARVRADRGRELADGPRAVSEPVGHAQVRRHAQRERDDVVA